MNKVNLLKICSTVVITLTLLFSAYSRADYEEDLGNCLRNDDEAACQGVEKYFNQYCRATTDMVIEYFSSLVAAKDKSEFANIRQEVMKKHQKLIKDWELEESDIDVMLLPAEQMAEGFYRDYTYQKRQVEMRSKKFKDFVSSSRTTGYKVCSSRMNSLLTTPDPFFEQLCHNGSNGHCLTLGVFSYLKQNYAQAIPFLKLACNGSDGASCYFLADIYLHGKEVQKNDEIAMLYSSKGCKLKDEDACEIYNSLKSAGKK
ncbi:MAG: sel1 repeat family protein [Cardiobacteriaceae bacterium]|nr:sel1 repeat family protein [Cardiobacteriaceae bacterium]